MDELHLQGRYDIVCLDSNGDVKWTEVAHNLCTNQGKNAMFTGFLAAGAVPATWYCSLITASSIAATSTYATPNVTEVTTGIAARLPITWGTAANGTLATPTNTPISFTITGANTIVGNMIVSGGSGVTNLGNTTAASGVLLSAGTFAGGSKTVGTGDVLNVTYSISM
jgi:hypothetical protein